MFAFWGCGFPSYAAPDDGSAVGAGGCDGDSCLKCPDDYANCDGDTDNGCETKLGTDTNCTDCGVICTNDHGVNGCVVDSSGLSRCDPTCAAGFDDCDRKPENGCETNIHQDSLNCGSCGSACPSNGGTPLCVAGICGLSSCNQGFGDCTNSGVCSSNLTTDPNNCGQCGHVCSAEHGSPLCNAGVCESDCDDGYGDCNGSTTNTSPPNDGCETKLNVPNSEGSVPNCGACGSLCKRRAFTTVNLQKCSEGTCSRDCLKDAYDCDNQRNDPSCVGSGCGCEYQACK
jgi:hypothetical protein